MIALLIGNLIVTKGTTTTTGYLLNGVQQGAIYALIAIGYTMVYGIIELINFAHGDVFTLGGFFSLKVSMMIAGALGVSVEELTSDPQHGVPFLVLLLVVLPTAMILSGLVGVVIERVAYRRLRDAPRLAPLITAIGVSFVLSGIMFVWQGSGNVSTGADSWLTGIVYRDGAAVLTSRGVFVIVAAVGLMFGLQLFIKRSRMGRAMRATAQDRDAALVCGININRTISSTFFIGSALAGAAGLLWSMYYGSLTWSLGYRAGIVAFTAAVLGGIGNIVGAGLGGFLIAIISVLAETLLGGEWGNIVIFATLVVILTFRPTGLLGSQVADRA
ncbi:MAG: branched-chain amino acid ABC transporter permease [Candidatus Dormibacteria bacterium]